MHSSIYIFHREGAYWLYVRIHRIYIYTAAVVVHMYLVLEGACSPTQQYSTYHIGIDKELLL